MTEIEYIPLLYISLLRMFTLFTLFTLFYPVYQHLLSALSFKIERGVGRGGVLLAARGQGSDRGDEVSDVQVCCRCVADVLQVCCSESCRCGFGLLAEVQVVRLVRREP